MAREHSRTSAPDLEPAFDEAAFPTPHDLIYMIGIGGCGMSGLARLLRARGARVCGSDTTPSPFTKALAADGFEVSHDQSGALPDACDLVVASAAIRPEHPEVLEAHRRGIEVLTYAEALGRAMGAHTGVAIAGTHGKSTTAAMLGCALADARLSPSVIVGATCPQLAPNGATGSGFRLGSARIPAGEFADRPGLLIAEACEFNRSFHNLRPTIASIASVEADHLDIYGSLDAVVEAFAEFARLVPPASEGGYLLIGESGAHRREITAGLACEVETIGYSPASDWIVRTFDPMGAGGNPANHRGLRVELVREGKVRCSWEMRLPGAHNAFNAAVAAVLALRIGADAEAVGQSLTAFRGIDRRTQYLGDRPAPSANGIGGVVRVWDDYGHHPTECAATLRALRDFDRPQDRGGRVVVVFQPHQHSRTRFLLDEFASAFADADVVIVPHIYFVRDSQAEKHKVSAADLVDRLRDRGVRAMHLYPFEAIVEQLENVCRAGDTLVVMGAGPVGRVAHDFVRSGAQPRIITRETAVPMPTPSP